MSLMLISWTVKLANGGEDVIEAHRMRPMPSGHLIAQVVVPSPQWNLGLTKETTIKIWNASAWLSVEGLP